MVSTVTLVLVANLAHSRPAAQSDSTAPLQDSLFSPVLERTAHLPDPDGCEKIRPVRLALVAGGLAGTIAAIHIYQMNGWWKENRRSFHFQEDLKYGLNVDKLGHFYGGTAATYIFRRSFRWANLSETSSLWWGAGASALFQTYVEIEDGFSTWGFDRVDFASDVAGAFYPVAQHYFPALRDFNMKFSYHPSPLLNEAGGAGFRGQRHIMFDDYEGQTIWFSARVHNLLPESARSFWPEWLCLALGYGVRDVGTTNPYRVYFIALDLDMTKILPQDSPFLQTLAEVLNFVHMPLPAVRVSPNVAWFGVYF
jgi:hypothetical protein